MCWQDIGKGGVLFTVFLTTSCILNRKMLSTCRPLLVRYSSIAPSAFLSFFTSLYYLVSPVAGPSGLGSRQSLRRDIKGHRTASHRISSYIISSYIIALQRVRKMMTDAIFFFLKKIK
ncbi:hypothetical protein F5879DRAFT_219269 [Lentinula edodes]|nr:hypothetical protein F5879DRAFT_219269 [Lentinula edodes]